MLLLRVAHDDKAAVLVEATIMMIIIFVFVLGSIDFLLAFYQWNAATKAVQLGARIAAVSDPVALGLDALSNAVVDGYIPPGGVMPAFVVTCDGETRACTCNGACLSVNGYNAAAMDTIVFGRGSSSCSDAANFYEAGMCDIFHRIKPANLIITYAQTGLGFAGRPGGPVPTITVAIKNLSFQFLFLNALRGFRDLPIPALTSSITAEDLSSGST